MRLTYYKLLVFENRFLLSYVYISGPTSSLYIKKGYHGYDCFVCRTLNMTLYKLTSHGSVEADQILRRL